MSLLTAVSLRVFVAMDVCYAASGELLLSLSADVVDGQTAKWLKGSIAAASGMSRHRQRLFLGEVLLGDNDVFACACGPLVVQLVILPFAAHDPGMLYNLTRAAFANNHRRVEQILQLPLDPNHCDFNGLTPLGAAAEAGAARAVSLLIEASADTELAGPQQRSPLHVAAQRGRGVVVKLLLEASASTASRDADGQTALHLAAGRRCPRPVTLLLQHRAAVNSRDGRAQTPLFMAARENDSVMCGLLLDARADLMAQNRNGDTPLHVAVRESCQTAVAFLHAAGAAATATNNAGRDALHLAQQMGCGFRGVLRPEDLPVCQSDSQSSAAACGFSAHAGAHQFCPQPDPVAAASVFSDHAAAQHMSYVRTCHYGQDWVQGGRGKGPQGTQQPFWGHGGKKGGGKWHRRNDRQPGGGKKPDWTRSAGDPGHGP